MLFSNNRAFQTEADRWVLDLNGNRLYGTNWKVQLYFGTEANSLFPVAATPAHLTDPDAVGPGVWIGGMRTLPGFLSGETATLQVRVWDGALFGSFEQALANGGIHGQSAPFSYLVPPVGSAPMFYYMENFRGFQLVPEPSSVALLLMGACGLWLRRRRL